MPPLPSKKSPMDKYRDAMESAGAGVSEMGDTTMRNPNPTLGRGKKPKVIKPRRQPQAPMRTQTPQAQVHQNSAKAHRQQAARGDLMNRR